MPNICQSGKYATEIVEAAFEVTVKRLELITAARLRCSLIGYEDMRAMKLVW